MAEKPLHQRRWFQIAVSVSILALLATTLDLGTLREFIRRGDREILLLLALLFPADRVFMAWKWHLLVRAKGSTMRLWTAIRIYLASGAVGLIVPLGGVGPDMARVAMLSHHGMPMSLAVPSILVERACGVLGSAIMLAVSIGVLVVMVDPQPGMPLERGLWIAGWTVVIVAAGLGATYAAARVSQVERLAGRLIDRLRLRPHVQTLRSYADNPLLLGVSVFLACVQQAIGMLALFLAALSFSVDLTFLQAAAIVPFAAILERLPISWGGIGVREAGVVVLAGLFGVPSSDALLLSLANYSLYLVMTIPLAGLYFWERKDEQRRAEPN
jgi:uncharacterized protein (TIRG00374 family)